MHPADHAQPDRRGNSPLTMPAAAEPWQPRHRRAQRPVEDLYSYRPVEHQPPAARRGYLRDRPVFVELVNLAPGGTCDSCVPGADCYCWQKDHPWPTS